jgi:hypothetical protein
MHTRSVQTRSVVMGWLLGTAVVLMGSGCVERRFIIESDPAGAIVYFNGQPIGATPVDVPFLYYGTYRFTLIRDGFEATTVDQEVKAPIYAYPPLDFVSENLYPGTIRDVRRFRYQLRPMSAPVQNEIFDAADRLRGRGLAIPVEEKLAPEQPAPSPLPIVSSPPTQ